MKWPFKWKLSACTYTWCYLFFKISQMKFGNLVEICFRLNLAMKGLKCFFSWNFSGSLGGTERFYNHKHQPILSWGILSIKTQLGSGSESFLRIIFLQTSQAVHVWSIATVLDVGSSSLYTLTTNFLTLAARSFSNAIRIFSALIRSCCSSCDGISEIKVKWSSSSNISTSGNYKGLWWTFIRKNIYPRVCIICLSLRLQQITQTSVFIINDIMLNLIQ